MKLNEQMLTALNEQYNAELSNYYNYTAMASFFEGISLVGIAAWFEKQASDEQMHAEKFRHYILDRNGKVEHQAVEPAEQNWPTALEPFVLQVKLEEDTSANIYKLKKLAFDLDDYATDELLDWYVSEQVEEEDKATKALDRMKIAINNPAALLDMDREFAESLE